MREHFNIGLIQPKIPSTTPWGPKDGPYDLNMNGPVAESIWVQIKQAIKHLINGQIKPDVILIPELHVAPAFINQLKNLTVKHGVMIIAGIDFMKSTIDDSLINNTARIFIPNNWPSKKRSRFANILRFGKTNFTYMEKKRFENQSTAPKVCREDPETNMYVLKTSEFGNIGLMICSDFFDIDRYNIYQGKIHHLFLIALNKDLNTYFHLAESLTRLLYSNIIVCNSGTYGGSVVHSPYREPRDRTLYKHMGNNLFTYQLVQVPVKSLDEAQAFDFDKDDKDKAKIKFKAWPPGYKKTPVDQEEEDVPIEKNVSMNRAPNI